MSEMFDDHTPQTCNYQQCGNPDSEHDCPFVRSDPVRLPDGRLVPPHHHNYGIPVEWKYQYLGNLHGLTSKVVTRLRCLCGHEIERKPTTP